VDQALHLFLDSLLREANVDINKLSKNILNRMFKEDYTYVREDLPNREYLENCLDFLYKMSVTYRNQSEDVNVDARHRANARDLFQNCLGLINGIKFSISFLDHKDVNLFEYVEENNEEPKETEQVTQ